MTWSPAERQEFIDAIAEAVATKLASQPRLVDRVELSRVLGVSVPSLERLQASGQLPVVRIGRRCLYDPSACIAALATPATAPGATSDTRSQYRVLNSSGQP
jgi:hypothetical protein